MYRNVYYEFKHSNRCLAHKMYNKTIWICYSADWTIIQCEFIVILFDTFSRGSTTYVCEYICVWRANSKMNRFHSHTDILVHRHTICGAIEQFEKTHRRQQIKHKRRNREKEWEAARWWCVCVCVWARENCTENRTKFCRKFICIHRNPSYSMYPICMCISSLQTRYIGLTDS